MGTFTGRSCGECILWWMEGQHPAGDRAVCWCCCCNMKLAKGQQLLSTACSLPICAISWNNSGFQGSFTFFTAWPLPPPFLVPWSRSGTHPSAPLSFRSWAFPVVITKTSVSFVELCPLLAWLKAISALKKKSLRKEWTFNLEWRVEKKKRAEVPSGRQVTHSNGKPNFNQLLSHYHTQTLWISWTIYLRLVPLKLGSYSFKRSFHFTLPR